MSELDDVLLELRDVGIRQLPEAGDAGGRRVRQALEEEMARGGRRLVWTGGQGRIGAPDRRSRGRLRVPRTGRSRRFAVAGAVAVAGLAIAGVFGLQGGGLTPSPAVAATMDRLAHLVVSQDWSGIPGPGQYLYTKSEGIVLAGAGTHNVDHRQAWLSSDGHMLVSDPRAAPNSATNPDSEVQSLGSPSSYFPTTVSGWQALSTDPATLLQQLKEMDAPNGPDTSAEQFTVVGDALRGTLIPPAVSTVLYRAVALIPGVQLMGPQTDPTGQSGLGVGYYAGGKLQSELIFDQQTARLLSELDYDQDGNLTVAWSYLEQKIVDSTPSVGSPPPATEFPKFHVATPQGQTTTSSQSTTTP